MVRCTITRCCRESGGRIKDPARFCVICEVEMQELTVKQLAFCYAYIEHHTIKAACEATGISNRSGTYYLNLPAVKDRIREIRSSVNDQQLNRLLAASDEAINVLLDVIRDPHAKPYSKVQAAEVILSHKDTAYNTTMVDDQIEEIKVYLEGNVVDAQKSRQGNRTVVAIGE